MSWYNHNQKEPPNDSEASSSSSGSHSSSFEKSVRRRRPRHDDGGPSGTGTGVLGGISLPSPSFFSQGKSRWGTVTASNTTKQYSNNERGSSLVPIWALAHNSKIDHTTKATGVSSTTASFSNHSRHDNFGMFRGGIYGGTTNTSSSTSMFASRLHTQQQQQQEMESCFDSSNRSWIASNATISKDGSAVANKTSGEAVVDSIPNFNAGLRNKSRSNDGTSDEINTKYVKKTRQLKRFSDNHRSKDDAVSEYNGTKTWVRSGNNWVMTDSTSRFRFMNYRQSDLDASSNNQNKRNPTAVSSFGTSSGGFAQTTSSMAMPHQAVSASNFLEYRPNKTTANDATSAISSYTPSSTYGLYTRQRLTKTADGFPYMPSLHLVPKKGSTASGGISGTTGISGPLSSNASLSDHRRFQRSYLLNAKPVSNQSSAFQLQQIDDAFVEKKDSKNSEASLLVQASSGYDSEREQRLKEWKENFVKKFIRAEPLVKDSPNRKNSLTRSLESDNDESDIVNRVTRFENRKEEKHDQRLSTASNVTLKDNKLDGRKHLVDTLESGYDPTNYTIRMKQWREQQYKDYGIPFRGSKKRVDSFEDVQVDGCDSDSQSYDSDSSRKRRLQEWKEQFACVDNTIRHTDHFEGLSPRSPPLRFSSLSAETGATNNDGADEEVGRDDINEKGVSVPSPSSRRGRDIPGGGIFPITSPHRKRNERSNNLNRMIPPQAATDDFLLSPANSSKVSDYLTTPKRANTSPTTENLKSNSFTTKNEKEVHVVAKAAKFLLGFAPQLSSDDGIITPTGDCFMNALDINSPCQGLPSFPSDSMLENNKERSFGTGDFEYSQDLESETLFDNFAPIGTSLFANELKSKIPSWDNCLYVKSEGARSGRICITATHLVFIYEDDVSDALLERYGWNRDQIDELLLEMDNSPSRGATPVNVPLNESGEGEGIELIGSDGTNLSFMKLLEDGFSNSYDRQPGHDTKLSCRQTDTSLSDPHILTPKSSLLPIGTLDESIDAKNVELYSVIESHKSAADRFQPISASSSSLDESLSRDVPNHFVQRSESGENTLSLGSNEFVIDRCIIRACNEEASMRLHQDHSSVGKDNSFKPISDNEVIHDDEVLNENQTALSCHSEFDSCIDPDEERALYISGDNAKQSYIGIKWPLHNLGEIYDRRYMMKEVGVEIFSPSPTCTKANQQTEDNEIPLGPLGQLSLYLVIPGFDDRQYNFRRRKTPRRVTFIETLKVYAPHVSDYYWMSAPRLQRRWDWKKLSHDKSLEALTCAWTEGRISNYDYLLRLNAIAGRSFHDPGNYPVMPWVLSNYTSLSVPDLCDERNFRDLSKPMGALCPKRLRKFQDKYASLCYLTDTAIPPFMYGSHYSSTGGVVLHYLVRTRPFAGLHRQLQGGQFDLSDRLFRSIPQTWDMCSRTSTTEVKELTPEWYSNPLFLKNVHNFDLGICSVDGAPISDVVLPPWANNDPTKFIEIMQNALESDFCSSHLSKWIDLIFGYKQRGPEAEKANNIFYHLSYYDSYDLAKIDDEILRTEIELHIADFGSCPTQLYFKPHPSKTTCVKNKSEMNIAHEHFEG